METFNPLGGPSRLSRSAQMQALNTSRQDHEPSDSVCRFRAEFARQAVALWGLYANDYTFNSNTVAEIRFEIVNRAA